MTREDIIRMAREAGMDYLQYISPEAFEKIVIFSALVASAEREACAGIVVNEAMQYAEPVWAFEIVNDIKARGQE